MGSLAVASTLSGLAPEVSLQSRTVSFGRVVWAQNSVTDKEAENFAAAAIEIEALRKKVVQELGAGTIAGVACHELESLKKLSEADRKKVETFCEDVETIIESSGLTVKRYNGILVIYNQNSDVKKKINAAVRRLQ